MDEQPKKLTETPADKVTYQIFKFDEKFDHWMLKVSGSQADCPYQSVAVFPRTDGAFVTIKQPCTSQCPLARVWKGVDGSLHYEISCGGVQRDIDVTEEERSRIEKISGILKPL